MKKLFLAAASLALSFAAQASIFITNSTDCTFVMALHAHDANNPAPCSYKTGYFDVPLNAALAYNNVTVLNGVVGWEGPGGVWTNMVLTGSNWDAASFYMNSFTIVGDPSGCAPGMNASGNFNTCAGLAYIDWTPLPNGNILVDIHY